ncbi:protein of unknown function (plasmid) [Ectopseudomonas oleovorans]|nr:protein of unknown function [Pseudomonas oleovorans]
MGGCFARPRTASPPVSTDGSPRPVQPLLLLGGWGCVRGARTTHTPPSTQALLRLPGLHAYSWTTGGLYDDDEAECER